VIVLAFVISTGPTIQKFKRLITAIFERPPVTCDALAQINQTKKQHAQRPLSRKTIR